MKYQDNDGFRLPLALHPQLWLAFPMPMPCCAPCSVVPEYCSHQCHEHHHELAENDCYPEYHEHEHKHEECHEEKHHHQECCEIEEHHCREHQCCDPCQRCQSCCCKRCLCGTVCLPRNRGVCEVKLDIIKQEICCCKLMVFGIESG